MKQNEERLFCCQWVADVYSCLLVTCLQCHLTVNEILPFAEWKLAEDQEKVPKWLLDYILALLAILEKTIFCLFFLDRSLILNRYNARSNLDTCKIFQYWCFQSVTKGRRCRSMKRCHLFHRDFRDAWLCCQFPLHRYPGSGRKMLHPFDKSPMRDFIFKFKLH